MRTVRLMPLALFLVLLGFAPADPARFEKEIQKFEELDRQTSPKPGGILFTGSSSIRMWKTDESFPGKGVLNRGFGGSTLDDVLHYFDRVVNPYKPKVIVFYCGENDLAAGKTVDEVFENYKKFVALAHEKLPDARLVYISIKPSPSRWKLADSMRKTNSLIREHAEKDKASTFVDVFTPMLDESGQPKKELFIEDQLHLNAEGYKLWTKLIGPLIEK